AFRKDNENYTIENRVPAGSGLGSFDVGLTDLEPDTVYFVAVYMTNSQGTYYSDEMAFNTVALPEEPSNTLLDDLTSWWEFDETAGTTAEDSHSDHDGVISGSV